MHLDPRKEKGWDNGRKSRQLSSAPWSSRENWLFRTRGFIECMRVEKDIEVEKLRWALEPLKV